MSLKNKVGIIRCNKIENKTHSKFVSDMSKIW